MNYIYEINNSFTGVTKRFLYFGNFIEAVQKETRISEDGFIKLWVKYKKPFRVGNLICGFCEDMD